MKPSTSLGTRSNVGMAKPSPPVRQAGNIGRLLVIHGVCRRSVPSRCPQVKYRCRCRVIVSRDPSNQRDILFQQSPNHSGEIPEEQLALKDQIEQTLAILRMLFPNDDARFREYFDPLVSLAQTGLV